MKAILLAAFIAAGVSVFAENPKVQGESGQTPASDDPLGSIVIPKVDFRDATLEEVVQYLSQKTKREIPDGKGSDFVFADENLRKVRINVAVRNTPLSMVIRYCAMLADCEIRKQGGAYVFTTKGAKAIPGAVPVPALPKRTGKALMTAVGITVPKLDLRESTLRMAMEFIQAKSMSLDPRGEGVNIILRPGADTEKTRITIKLVNMPLSDAVRQIAMQAGYEVLDDDFALILRPKTK